MVRRCPHYKCPAHFTNPCKCFCRFYRTCKISCFLACLCLHFFAGNYFFCSYCTSWNSFWYRCRFFTFLPRFFELPLAIIRATPVVAFILIALFWFKSGTVPVFVSVLMTLPIMTTAVANGFYKTDEKLLVMAHVFKLSRRQIFRYIQLPSLVPFFLNGMVSTFGLTWKVVAAGEVLSLPKYAAGTMLQKAQVHLETSTVMAVAIILVIVSFVLEQLFMLAVKKLTARLQVGV